MVTKDMSIAQVLKMDMETAPIFLEYGMHCLGCPMSTAESIEDACAAHGVDADALVAKLNEFLSSK
jgi:hybrid cluster-associated redox disulfide protein